MFIRLPKVKVNDINFYYEIRGEGYPLVMIQGYTQNIYYWDSYTIEEFSKSFKTINFDNRGMGLTEAPNIDFSIKTLADDTAGLMDVLNIERAYVLGHSMGGMIAQELVLNYPERVEKLVLCSTHCGGEKSIPPSSKVMDLLTNPRKGITHEEMAREIYVPVEFTEVFIKDNPDFIEQKIRNYIKTPISGSSSRRQFNAIMKFDTSGRLKKIKTPTLVIHGKKDILVPPQNAEILAKLIPDAKLTLLENSAHGLFSMEPNLACKTILEFLNT